MKYVNGSLLDVKEGYILHQTNCVTLYPKGLAEDIEKKFPGTCPYRFRKGVRVAREEDRSVPGTVFIIGAKEGPIILNLFGQYGPGKNCYPGHEDTPTHREKYFADGLEALVDYFEGTEENIKIAVPYKIGCGLAGGKWGDYRDMLESFENKMKEAGINTELTVYIFQPKN